MVLKPEFDRQLILKNDPELHVCKVLILENIIYIDHPSLPQTIMDCFIFQFYRVFELLKHKINEPFYIDLGDGPVQMYHNTLGLELYCFCKHKTLPYSLIPDSEYVLSKGYSNYNDTKQFDEKISKAFWRGSSTGSLNPTTIDENLRVKLCESVKNSDIIDAKITLICQMEDQNLIDYIKNNLLSDAVTKETFYNYKYLIDIDGNTNAWSSFFTKLKSNSVVLKVKTNFKQWFYDMLEPYVHYIPIENTLEDIEKKIRWCEEHQDLCVKISNNANELCKRIEMHSKVQKPMPKFCLNISDCSILPMGRDCCSRRLLTELGYQKTKKEGELTCVFDLCVTPYLTVIELLKTNFNDYHSYFLENDNIYNKKGVFFLHESEFDHKGYAHIYDSKVPEYVKNITNFTDNNFQELKTRYERRIQNFNEKLSHKQKIFIYCDNENNNPMLLYQEICKKSTHDDFIFLYFHISNKVYMSNFNHNEMYYINIEIEEQRWNTTEEIWNDVKIKANYYLSMLE